MQTVAPMPRSSKSFPERVRALVESNVFTYVVLCFILLNGILIGVEVSHVNEQVSHTIEQSHNVLLVIFTLELILRFIACLPRWPDFFKSGWHWFDLFVVGSGYLFGGAQVVQVARLLRLFRVVRVISVIPSLQRMITAVLYGLPSMGSIMLLLGLLFYVYGVVGVSFFGSVNPERFGSLPSAWLALFQIVTLENWPDVMAPVIAHFPWAWTYFVSFILLGTFVVFNLFVGVLVSSMEETSRNKAADAAEAAAGVEPPRSSIEAELAGLRGEIAELKALLVSRREGGS